MSSGKQQAFQLLFSDDFNPVAMELNMVGLTLLRLSLQRSLYQPSQNSTDMSSLACCFVWNVRGLNGRTPKRRPRVPGPRKANSCVYYRDQALRHL